MAQTRLFDVPAGNLTQGIIALAQQAGVTIATTDRDAAAVRVRAVRRAPTLDAALRTMLKGSGFEAVRLPGGGYAVRRSARPPSVRPPPTPPPPRPVPDSGIGVPEIVVTAAKLRQPLATFPGTAYVVDADSPALRSRERQGSAAIVAELPVMASTGLGPGRDKLFVRGIADSSFSGSTQATIGQYLGEVRLNYNAPDPSLALYDLASVELLEGPQATLYGAGSLGGVLRLVPRKPVPARWEGNLTASLSLAANERVGREIAGVVNMPLGATSAARIVGYGSMEPGFIDDSQRQLRATGRSSTVGGRATIATDLGDRWTIELGGAYQHIRHSDARYAEGDTNPPSRASAIAQPASNRLALASVTVRKAWDSGLELTSASAFVQNDLDARYDLSRISPGVSNETRNNAKVISNETRLSRSRDSRSGWLVGLHVVSSSNDVITALDRDGTRMTDFRIGTGVTDVGLFAQATLPIAPRWSVTLGGRVSYAQLRSSGPPPTDFDIDTVSLLKKGKVRFLPSAAIGWYPSAGITVYLRYQRGYRTGGLAIIPIVDPDEGLPIFSVGSYDGDTLDMVEAGLRIGDTPASPVSGTLAVSATRWRNIQSDLFDSLGPYTINAGDARILGLEGTASWRPSPAFTVLGAFFLADAALERNALNDSPARREHLPNIPLITGRLDAQWQHDMSGETKLTLRGRARYVGRSYLGVGPSLSISQGNYIEMSASAQLEHGRITTFLDIDNLLDVRGNRFALGNPFTASYGDQRTPLRPRTVRIGVRTAF